MANVITKSEAVAGAWVLNSARTRATLATLVEYTENAIEVFNTEKQESQFFSPKTGLALGEYWSFDEPRPKLVQIDNALALSIVKDTRTRALKHQARTGLGTFLQYPSMENFEKFSAALAELLPDVLPDAEFGEQLGLKYPSGEVGTMTSQGMENWRASLIGLNFSSPGAPMRRLVTGWTEVRDD